ncbi:MAG: hypothetical protein IJY39_00175 [Clostridia bacterium]|nr:hypothetical protein [Clostridia bacterium]
MKKKKENRDISFLGRAILLFRGIAEKVKALRLPERIVEKQKQNAGYVDETSPKEARLSYGFGMARLCSVSLLCVFLAIALIFGGGIISYENVYYMFKDIGYISSFSESRPESLNYSKPFDNQDFATFKNGLAVAGDSEIKFFTSTGRMTLTVGSEFTNPRITCSDSHALIYDQGRNSFTVYNSFISVYSETLDYPISSAHMSADGSFCVVTKSGNYGSVVRVYDREFRLESEYSKNDYVLSAEVSSDGKYVAVMSLDAADGDSLVRLNVLKRGEDELYSSALLYDVMPYSATFLSNDRIALFCSELVVIYDLKGNMKKEYGYPGKLSHLSVGNGEIAMMFDEGSLSDDNRLIVLESNGTVKYSERIVGNVFDLELCGGFAYLLCEGEIVRLDTTFGFRSGVEFSEENARLVTFENGDVMACTDGIAYYITFD